MGLIRHRDRGNGTSCAAPGFNTVQAAVTAAPAGATVKVCGGTYIEQVEITKSLTLTGTNGTVTLALPASPIANNSLAGAPVKLFVSHIS